jgi:hypothetical protein
LGFITSINYLSVSSVKPYAADGTRNMNRPERSQACIASRNLISAGPERTILTPLSKLNSAAVVPEQRADGFVLQRPRVVLRFCLGGFIAFGLDTRHVEQQPADHPDADSGWRRRQAAEEQ